MTSRRMCIFALVLLFPLVSCAAGTAAEKGDRIKVGFIDLQRLVHQSRMGREASANLQKSREEKEALLTAKLQQANALKDVLKAEGDKMTQEQRSRKLREHQELTKEYQRLAEDVKEDIMREDRELVSTILKQADGVLKRVAEREKYGIILKDSNAIGFLHPSVDITDMMIKELDKK